MNAVRPEVYKDPFVGSVKTGNKTRRTARDILISGTSRNIMQPLKTRPSERCTSRLSGLWQAEKRCRKVCVTISFLYNNDLTKKPRRNKKTPQKNNNKSTLPYLLHVRESAGLPRVITLHRRCVFHRLRVCSKALSGLLAPFAQRHLLTLSLCHVLVILAKLQTFPL